MRRARPGGHPHDNRFVDHANPHDQPCRDCGGRVGAGLAGRCSDDPPGHERQSRRLCRGHQSGPAAGQPPAHPVQRVFLHPRRFYAPAVRTLPRRRQCGLSDHPDLWQRRQPANRDRRCQPPQPEQRPVLCRPARQLHRCLGRLDTDDGLGGRSPHNRRRHLRLGPDERGRLLSPFHPRQWRRCPDACRFRPTLCHPLRRIGRPDHGPRRGQDSGGRLGL